jgi:hypothetical protein
MLQHHLNHCIPKSTTLHTAKSSFPSSLQKGRRLFRKESYQAPQSCHKAWYPCDFASTDPCSGLYAAASCQRSTDEERRANRISTYRKKRLFVTFLPYKKTAAEGRGTGFLSTYDLGAFNLALICHNEAPARRSRRE